MRVLLFIVLSIRAIDLCKSEPTIVNNGYAGVLIAIDHQVPEDENLITAIKNMMTDASADLFTATKKRAYFREITILVPSNWTSGKYAVSNKEAYKYADIRIAPPHPQLQHNPYALTYVPCGEMGGKDQYIHLTPEYMTNPKYLSSYGPRGKVVVHEWGHYRWGVKDEYPTNDKDKFYLSTTNEPMPTGCSGYITGKFLDSNGQECEPIESSRLPSTNNCRFIRYSNQPEEIISSMMYKQFIGQVSTFCHDDPSDPMNVHNKEAPNNHNRQCNYRSTWDVIMNSVDFQNGAVNPPNPTIQNTDPSFKVVRPGPKRIVLIMDISGSMYGKRLDDLRSASELPISSLLGDGMMLGLVAFSESAVVLQPLTKIGYDDGSREKMIKSLPSSVNGSTGIGAGILEGIKVLSKNGQLPEGGKLIVLTDGEENAKPFVEDITADAIKSGVVVDSIFFGLVDVSKDASLASLSLQTGGKWYYASTSDQSVSQLSGIFASLSKSDDGNFSANAVQVLNKIIKLKPGTPDTVTAAIDGSVGNRTVFVFKWTDDEPTIELKPPKSTCIYSNSNNSNKKYCDDSPIHKTDENFKLIKFHIPGTAKLRSSSAKLIKYFLQIGIWEFNMFSTSENKITTAVISRPSDLSVYPITVETELKVSDNTTLPPIIIAKVFQNFLPVLGASVNATVTRPDDTISVVELFDNGAGPDVNPKDGVYSRYFADFSAIGRHAVEIHVTRDGKDRLSSVLELQKTDYDDGVLLDDGTYVSKQDNSANPSAYKGVNVEGVIERTSSSPGFAYTGSITADDIFPPNMITDLTASQVDLDNVEAGLLLEFTAPGNDYDSGNASRYEIRFSYDPFSSSKFSDWLIIKDEWINDGQNNKPNMALSDEKLSIVLADLPKNDTVRIAFAIKAYDDANNPSEISNIAITTYFIKPPPIKNKIDSNMKWIILGVVAGSAVLIAAAILSTYLFIRNRRSKRGRDQKTNGTGEKSNMSQ
uniref:calcium-activated chloride channel regulator 1-like n=1 Tax=Styela clava TaxID=7725 RepID=UPI00193A9929|nr:calcium-activated chloride channel regulator 1-like [Styela clava]